MAIGDIDIGNSYISMLYGDVTRPEYATFTPNFKLLPAEVAPIEKQIRVFIKGTEMGYLDTRALDRLTTDYYTYTTDAPTAGVRCWGIRFTCDAISETPGDEQGTALVTIYDQDDVVILWDEKWMDDNEALKSDTWGDGTTNDQLNDDSFTTDPATGTTETVETTWSFGVTNFPRAMDINRIGWTRAHDNPSDQTWENVMIEVNVGTPHAPNWIVFGDSTLHTVQNVASAHTPGADSLTLAMYPALSSPAIIRGTDDIWFDWTTNGNAARDLDIPVPVITVVAASPMAKTNDRALILRETRQDQPWVVPTNGAYALDYGLWWYFEQIRFVVQELCELADASNLLGLPPVSQETNTYASSLQSVEYDATAEDTFDYTSIELLNYAPAGNITPQDQLEVATASTSDGPWDIVDFDATPADVTEYNIVGDNVVLGAITSLQVRIRRVTRTDQYWFPLLNLAAGHWNTGAIDLIQKQARFMIEESCFLPAFFNDSPLSQGLFRRNWNWFRYVGTRSLWTIPGSTWGGSGGVIVFVNDVEQIEGTDYTIEGPAIIWTTAPVAGDVTSIGVGGGGWGGGVGGGGDTEDISDGPTPEPTEDAQQIDWPGLDLPPDCGISVAIGSKAQSDLASGSWEGGTNVDFSQGNVTSVLQFGSSPMRIAVTVTQANTVSDGGGGFHDVGATDVCYINKICDPNGSNVLRAVAAAWHNGDSNWSSDEASAALGCLQPAGATGGFGLYALAGCTVTSSSPPQWQLYNSLINITGAIAGGDIDQVPYMGQWKELLEQADNAATEGWTSETGFTSAQFDDFIDPDTDLTDFDDPAP